MYIYATLLIFRAPEMVDLYSNPELTHAVDIWVSHHLLTASHLSSNAAALVLGIQALGCMLYFTAFWVHPFEEAGNLGILSARYKAPDACKAGYSEDLNELIRRCLQVGECMSNLDAYQRRWLGWLPRGMLYSLYTRSPRGMLSLALLVARSPRGLPSSWHALTLCARWRSSCVPTSMRSPHVSRLCSVGIRCPRGLLQKVGCVPLL
jgi:hypothetical protein